MRKKKKIIKVVAGVILIAIGLIIAALSAYTAYKDQQFQWLELTVVGVFMTLVGGLFMQDMSVKEFFEMISNVFGF